MSDLSRNNNTKLLSSKFFNLKQSNSPTFHSSQPSLTSRSEKTLWPSSFKNEPIPTQIKRRVLGKKYKFEDDSEDQDEVLAVLEEDQQEQVQKNRKKLPKFHIVSDWGQFSDFRLPRIQSEKKRHFSSQRCRSVSSLKLPQVVEEKKQEDELKKLYLSKLTSFKDNNEFGQRKGRYSSSEYTSEGMDVLRVVQSTEGKGQLSRVVPEEISESEAEETKSVKCNEKSIIESEFEKLIVDELDEMKKRKEKEEVQEMAIQSIMEEKADDNEVDTDKLHQSLSKFESESEYLTNLTDEYLTKNQKLNQIQKIDETLSDKSS